MELKFHVPTQQYGFLEISGTEENLPEMEQMYNRYAEVPLSFRGDGLFKEVETFTGEKIMYDRVNHKYTDLQGNPLLSGSEYKKLFDKPFDMETISNAVGKKNGVDPESIREMWERNSLISRTFGNAIHYTMEQYFKNKDNGTENEYHLPKHILLRNIVESFPKKDSVVFSEVMVSDVKRKMVGQIDAIEVIKDKEINLWDFKSDGKIDNNVEGHFRQLSFYADILKQFGYDVKEVIIWNYTTEWKEFKSKPLDIDERKLWE